MKLTVAHTTTYRYARPLRGMVQSLRLSPSRFEGQRVDDWQVTVRGFAPPAMAGGQPEGRWPQQAAGRQTPARQTSAGQTQAQQTQAPPPDDPSADPGWQNPAMEAAVVAARCGASFRDGAGDLVETMTLRGPIQSIRIAVTGSVETSDLHGVLRGHRESVPPGVYLRATRATEPDVALTELARGVIAASEGSAALARAHALSKAVTDAIAYVPGATEAGTTAAEALARGEGVCQDHAHALIALAHVAGLPARYVVGYLHAGGSGDATAEVAAGASHAWAEIWVDGLGWVGFDAANRCCPDDRYIRLCSGDDAQDAAPIRGIAGGAEAETMQVDVAVQRQSQ